MCVCNSNKMHPTNDTLHHEQSHLLHCHRRRGLCPKSAMSNGSIQSHCSIIPPVHSGFCHFELMNYKNELLQVSSGATSWSPALCFPFCRAISLCSIWCCLPPSDRRVILTSSVLANSAHSMSCQALLSPFLWSASVKDTPIQSSLATVLNRLLTVKFLKVVRPFNAAAKEAQALRSHCSSILIALNIHFPRKASLVLKCFEDLV